MRRLTASLCAAARATATEAARATSTTRGEPAGRPGEEARVALFTPCV
jgi:hypothetical protein